MAIPLNTLAYARRLQEAGFTQEQAEGQAQALAEAMTDSLATKADLRDLETRVDARFDSVDARFAAVDARFEALTDGMNARFAAMSTQIVELERRMELRMGERFADLERRLTVRLLGGIAAVSALVKLL